MILQGLAAACATFASTLNKLASKAARIKRTKEPREQPGAGPRGLLALCAVAVPQFALLRKQGD
ncbi:MAG: hypothetical protein HC848_00960 [Limnobacter sp.]|nr:hypothetical protein [Limnobacter sp.]